MIVVSHFFFINEDAFYFKIPQIFKTWVIIFIGELFFRANGLHVGLKMFRTSGDFICRGIRKGWFYV